MMLSCSNLTWADFSQKVDEGEEVRTARRDDGKEKKSKNKIIKNNIFFLFTYTLILRQAAPSMFLGL